MDDDAPWRALATPDVLPRKVRRRWSRRDALLPVLLAGELMAGVLLAGVWQLATATPQPGVAAGPAAATTSGPAVLVLPPAPASAPSPPPRRTVPHNPFAVQVG